MTSEHVSHLVAVVDSIVNTTETFVEVTASPGSGKTHTLVQRVHHLRSVGVPASRILVLSFSKSSVGVLRRRLDTYPDTEASALKNVTVATAHAFALSLILKKKVLSDTKALPLVTSAVEIAITDCISKKLWPSVKPITRDSRLGQLQDLLEQPQQLKAVLSFFSVVSASRRPLPDVLAMSRFTSLLGHLKVLPAISRRFTAVKGKKGVIDYGDMLQLAIKAIQDNPQSVPFTHILVDEYQDCSAAQTHLLAELALAEAPYSTSASKRGPGIGMGLGLGLGRNIMVFGDANQAIFAFAGASYTPLSSVLPGVRDLALPLSRRLTAQTAALASAVAGQSQTETGTDRGLNQSKSQVAAIQTSKSGEMPVLVRVRSLRDQTKHIVADIEKLISEGEEPAKIVVLARTKALLQPVEQLLLANQLPTARAGSTRDRKHVLRVLKLLRLVERRERQAKKATVTKRVHIETDDLVKTMSSAIEMPVTDSRWKSEALNLANACKSPSLEGRFKQCAAVYLRLMGGVKAAANAEVQTEINRWQAFSRGYQGAKSMMMAVKSMPKSEAVATGTIHSAKGGEWDHVFIVGVTDGLLPLHYSWGDSASISEERNLLYVAITRAIKTVRMYHSPSANSKTGQKFKKLSRFLTDSTVSKTMLTKKAP